MRLLFALLPLLTIFSSVARADGEPFLWGVANSSFQTEGAADLPGLEAHSNWWEWEHELENFGVHRIADDSTADVSIDFWDRYNEDFDLTKKLGANAFRMSLSWERIEPEPGVYREAALQHYEDMIVAMRRPLDPSNPNDHGLEPVVTIFHSDMPLWIAHRNGVLNKRFPAEFADYAETVVKRLSGPPANVRYWLTVNEPATMAQGKYVSGSDPSDFYNKKGMALSMTGAGLKFLKALNGLVEAHLAAAARIRQFPGVMIGVASDWTVMQAPGHDPIASLASFFAKRVYDEYFLDGITKGGSNLCPLGPLLCPKFKYARGQKLPSVDLIGINYYSRDVFTMKWLPPKLTVGPGGGSESDSGTEIYPPGIEDSLQAVWQRYGLPVLVTENGVIDSNDHDAQRAQFLDDHIAYLQKARNVDHIPVIGYLYWSLVDNFEWSMGYTQKYGLCSVVPSTLERNCECSIDPASGQPLCDEAHARHSYAEYKKLISQTRMDDLPANMARKPAQP